MVRIFIILLWATGTLAVAQTKLNKSIPLGLNDKIELDFVWPKTIILIGWDKNEVKIEGSVSINNGQNDNAFGLNIRESGSILKIDSYIKDHDQLPQKIIFHKGDEEFFFNTDDRNSPEVQRFLSETGNAYDHMQHGVIKDIRLTIYVPQSTAVDIYSQYGLIEIKNFSGKLSASSKFGGIDIAVNTIDKGLKAGTKFGSKYSNLQAELKSLAHGNHPGKWDWIAYGNGSDYAQEIESEFGNIYIRKQ